MYVCIYVYVYICLVCLLPLLPANHHNGLPNTPSLQINSMVDTLYDEYGPELEALVPKEKFMVNVKDYCRNCRNTAKYKDKANRKLAIAAAAARRDGIVMVLRILILMMKVMLKVIIRGRRS